MTTPFAVTITVEAIHPGKGTGIAHVSGHDEHGNLVSACVLASKAKTFAVGGQATFAGFEITRYAGLRGPWDDSLEEAKE